MRPPPTPVPRVSITTSCAPWAAPIFHSAIAAAFASLSIPTGRPKRSLIRSRKSRSASGMFTDATARPERWSIREGIPKPSATTSSSTRRRRPRWRTLVLLGVLVLFVLFVVWAVASYLALASGDSRARTRLGAPAKAALDSDSGLLLGHTTDILVLGTDHSDAVGRSN